MRTTETATIPNQQSSGDSIFLEPTFPSLPLPRICKGNFESTGSLGYLLLNLTNGQILPFYASSVVHTYHGKYTALKISVYMLHLPETFTHAEELGFSLKYAAIILCLIPSSRDTRCYVIRGLNTH